MKWSQRLINPVLDKEIRLRMRTPKSAVSLMLYVLVLGFVAMGFIYVSMYLTGNNQRFNSSVSSLMFYVLSFAQLVLIAFMAPALSAGVISSEREKQTLNMLLTTQQRSSTIVLSKLLSSLSFMALIVVATLPVYSIVFLYGGISLKQLISLFLFYLFVMLLLGAIGVMFSTLFKKTILAITVTYGVGLFIFLVTGILYIFLSSIDRQSFYSTGGSAQHFAWTGYILGLNPAGAMLDLFQPGFSNSVFYYNPSSLTVEPPIRLWQEFVIVYSVVIVVSLWISIRKIRPVRGLRRRKKSDGNGNGLTVESEQMRPVGEQSVEKQ